MNELIVKYMVATYLYTGAMSWNYIESYQLQYQIYSSQQVKELYPLDINWYWILYQWKISMAINDVSTSQYGRGKPVVQ